MKDKKFRVGAPQGIAVVPKEVMTEKELKEFAMKFITDEDGSENDEIWKEKIKKDEIGSVVEWLEQLGCIIDEI